MRHAERHEAAGYRTSYAPVWTDSAARAVLDQLKADMAAWHTKKVGDYCLKVLSSDRDTASLLEAHPKLSLHDRGIASYRQRAQRPRRGAVADCSAPTGVGSQRSRRGRASSTGAASGCRAGVVGGRSCVSAG